MNELPNITRFICFESNLSKEMISKLEKNNLKLSKDLALFSDDDFKTIFAFSQNEIQQIKKSMNKSWNFNAISLEQLDQSEEYIKTGCEELDYAFGGLGLPTGRLCQICGEAGAGKSQICFQLCFRTQLGKSQGGLNGEVLYLDTECSFRPERIAEIGECFFRKQEIDSELIQFKIDELLAQIHIRNINTSADDLCNIILDGQLDLFLKEHSNIRLLILDSITYHFRYDYQYDNHIRNNQLMAIGNKLKQIAHEKNIAIVITNQVKMSNEPALGDLWNSVCSISLHLNRCAKDSDFSGIEKSFFVRKCSVTKSPFVEANYNFHYLVRKNGIVADFSC